MARSTSPMSTLGTGRESSSCRDRAAATDPASVAAPAASSTPAAIPGPSLPPADANAKDGVQFRLRGAVRGPLLGQGDARRPAQHQQGPYPDADRAGHRGRGARPVRRGIGGLADREQQGAQRRGGDLRGGGPFTAHDYFPARRAYPAQEAYPGHELQPAAGLTQVTGRARGIRRQGRVRPEQESGAKHEYDGTRHEEGRRRQRLDDAVQDISPRRMLPHAAV